LATATTFAEAPIGVPFPPISVPKEVDQIRGSRENPKDSLICLRIGAIVAAKGTLSMIEEPNALTQRMIDRAIKKFPLDAFVTVAETILSKPTCSIVPTIMKRPAKKKIVG
jgi:hypothetical protein